MKKLLLQHVLIAVGVDFPVYLFNDNTLLQ